ncbi:archease family protein [Cystoisospora suis]|uniref:Protein archease-like n=1 Tax=Cystoisospora suis TaxID=483139 RepID=A0A2C6K6K6_9APIC|nr:archease family protein [Cystoisospora suis]
MSAVPSTCDPAKHNEYDVSSKPEQELSRDDTSDVQVIRVGSLSVRSLPPRPSTRRHHRQPTESEPSEPVNSSSASPSRLVQAVAVAGKDAAVPRGLPTQDCQKETQGDPGFEYLDHTADVIIHAWGSSLREAFVNAGNGLFNYMTDTSKVEPKESRTVEAAGSDLENLLFHFMDELLFLYGSEYFVARDLLITKFDEKACVLACEAKGEPFDRSRHSQGTEVKAITMHEMKIWRKGIRASESIGEEDEKSVVDGSDGAGCDTKACEVFVLVDI